MHCFRFAPFDMTRPRIVDPGATLALSRRTTRRHFLLNPDRPEVGELRLQMPVALELDYGPKLARERIAERVRQRRHQTWYKAKRTGIAFAGPRRVLRQAP